MLHLPTLLVDRIARARFILLGLGLALTGVSLHAATTVCDNVTTAGSIAGVETGCALTAPFDPAPITSTAPADGGSGALQYLWMQTTVDPNGGGTVVWQPIAGSQSPDYDPTPITVTTWYTRCARRAGCVDYVAESNVIEKTVSCCDNVLTGGTIGFDQSGCGTVFPDELQSLSQPTGGTGALEYLWFSSFVGPPFVQGSPDWTEITGADQASYTPGPVDQTTWFIRCARRAGCTEFDGETNVVRIEVNAVPVIDLVPTPVSCADDADGQINLTVMGDDAPYTYAWSDGLPPVADQTALAPGTYQVTVTGANGCAAVMSTQVGAPLALVVDLSATQNSCSPEPDTLVATVSGGTSPYSYQWSDPALTDDPVQVFLPPGTYGLTVTDDAGCTAITSATINQATNINLSLSTTQPDCAGNLGQIGTTLSGGQAPYSYLWSTGATTAQITDLGPGDYGLTVTDAANCMVTDMVTLDMAGFDLTLAVGNPSCADRADGTLSATLSGGAAPFTYAWSTGATTADVSNLAAGTYTLTVTDAEGCTQAASATLTAPPALQVLLTAEPVSCAAATDGRVVVTNTSGGTAPFTYTWNVPTTGNGTVLNNLSPGNYALTVTDTNGCTLVDSATVTAPPALSLNIDQQNINCKGAADGQLRVTDVINGTAPFAYSWGNGETTAVIDNLVKGTYAVTVTDANGCTLSAQREITEPAELTVTVTGQNATCADLNDGGISAQIDGGTAPFQFLWSNGVTTATMTGLAPGAYTLTVTDANGCTATGFTDIAAISNLTLDVDVQGVSCSDADDGSIGVSATGGVGNYTYSWGDGSTDPDRSNLSGGLYVLTVTDENGCSVNENIVVAAPLALQVAISTTNVVCPEDTDGSLNVSVLGGTPGYTFLWNTGATGANLSGLGTGNYSVTVTDANGCSADAAVSVSATTTLDLVLASTDVRCHGDATGTVTAVVSGGLTPYQYTWTTGETTASIDVPAGSYGVTVTDAAGCVLSGSTLINEPAALSCKAQPLSLVTTHNGTQGAVEVEHAGGTGPYTYQWSNGATTPTVGAIPAGTYAVTVTDANGCTCTSSALLYNPSRLGDFVWEDSNANGRQDAGEPGLPDVPVTLTGTDANGPVNRSTTTDADGGYLFDGLLPGSYRVTFGAPTNYQFTARDQGGDESIDSDVDPATGETTDYIVTYDVSLLTVDAGLILLDNLIGLGDYAFYDADRDGEQDPGEGGVGGIGVTLYRANGSFVGQQTTDANGFYLFPDLLPGDYYVVFSLSNLADYTITLANATDDALDSDADPLTGQTPIVTLLPFSPDNLTVDIGVFQACENVIDGGTISGNETGCGPVFDPGVIVGTALPTGGFGAPEYLWLQSQIPVYNGPTDPNWSPAPGGTAADYDPGVITQHTYYIRCVRRAGCTDYVGESNVVEKLVTDPPLALVQSGPVGTCPGEALTFTGAIAGGGSTYAWDFGPAANVQFVNSRVVSGIVYNSPGTYTATLTVSRFGCSQTTAYTFDVLACLQVYPNPAVDAVTVQFPQALTQDTPLELLNGVGTAVHRQVAPTGATEATVPLRTQMDGTYWLVVRRPGQLPRRVRVVKVE